MKEPGISRSRIWSESNAGSRARKTGTNQDGDARSRQARALFSRQRPNAGPSHVCGGRLMQRQGDAP